MTRGGDDELRRWLETARRHHREGRRAEARRLYEAVLRRAPDHPAALNLFGALLEAEGDHAGSERLLRRAVGLRPEAASYHNNLGNALRSQGALAEAEACYREALRLRPGYAGAHFNLGVLLRSRGGRRGAVEELRRALEHDPDLVEARLALADLDAAEGRLADAEAAYRAVLGRAPRHAGAQFGLGEVLRRQGRIDAAVACFQRCVRLDRSFSAAYNNLGSLYEGQGRVGQAIACAKRAVALQPDSPEAHFNLGRMLEGERQLESARGCYERALSLSPGFGLQVELHLAHVRRLLCDWSAPFDATGLGQRIERELVARPGVPLPLLTLNLLGVPAPMRLLAARAQARGIERASAEARARLAFEHQPVEPERLRVGYVSPDFRGHAVGTLVHRMFELHDRDGFEVHAYSLVDVDDPFSRRIREGCDRFTDVAKESPEETARRIHADGIHVLIDLAGHTTYSRPAIFALRPAPVQAHYLGYLDTMGADFLPYAITDEVAVTSEMATHFSEALVTLPGCAIPSSPLPIGEASLERRDLGLPDDAFVFCCMNSPHKLDAEVFAAWMRILARAPHSVLWLFDGGSPAARENLLATAEGHGIARDRLHFAPKRTLPDYLAGYRLADLFLDTFAYNAGATAIGALQAGLPVLTRPGATSLARIGASICTAAGLAELVCESAEAYEERAVELAGNPARLAALRTPLARDRDAFTLFDTQASVRHLEHAYRLMWRDWVDGVGPRPLRIPADARDGRR